MRILVFRNIASLGSVDSKSTGLRLFVKLGLLFVLTSEGR